MSNVFVALALTVQQAPQVVIDCRLGFVSGEISADPATLKVTGPFDRITVRFSVNLNKRLVILDQDDPARTALGTSFTGGREKPDRFMLGAELKVGSPHERDVFFEVKEVRTRPGSYEGQIFSSRSQKVPGLFSDWRMGVCLVDRFELQSEAQNQFNMYRKVGGRR